MTGEGRSDGVMDCDTYLQTGNGGVVFSQPLLADLKSAGNRCLILQQRAQISTLAEVNDLFAEAFDPIGLG